ncbi:stage III sporulation protein AE [Ruminococcus sp. OA3]|uniref:stage III sporulation protein AE n=1 Tax=Ruminococcus sp. OA3 TaxID=2914164 RepID=UPI001F05D8DC|nr:stage III sporulation protein AE [Ruminococcus sp. OA3]MCH1983776.1 stage III sporulation protein AE [Ruminococcus sp. OA3]
MKKNKKRKCMLLILIMSAWFMTMTLLPVTCCASAAGSSDDQLVNSEDYEEELLDDMDTQQMQEIMDELLEDSSFSFLDAMKELLKGETPFSLEWFGEILKESLFSEFEQGRSVLGQVLLLAFAGAVLTSFVHIFDNEKMGDICFYLVYLLVFVLLLKAFGQLSEGLHTTLEGIVSFMQALAPSYYIAITAASGVTSATVFYQIILIVIFCVEYLLVNMMIPAIHIYVLLEFINLLTKEEMLSRISELLKSAILWAQKSMLTVIVGMQIIQSLVAPAVDSLKRSVLGKTVSVIPGVGNAVNAVTEIIFGSAVLIRNCFGVTALIVLIVCSIAPVIRLGFNALVYKFIGAVIQPICDSRLVGCFHAMGEGCGLLLKVLFTTQVMFLLTIVILANSLQ